MSIPIDDSVGSSHPKERKVQNKSLTDDEIANLLTELSDERLNDFSYDCDSVKEFVPPTDTHDISYSEVDDEERIMSPRFQSDTGKHEVA
ncbi:hypothetical protein NPIL_147941 [Nephila pilipes]|uniref:Uncharacterized protein n=1 Tax=Nephila pilipes TaxID=299642 RepID=A0A8X6MEN4_NEPPI|nr:hypothetical protein NPIL_147941 [Nephila pilipes]